MSKVKTSRVIVYCRSFNMCSDLYIYFLLKIVIILVVLVKLVIIDYLECIIQVAIPTYNKEVILKSMESEDGTIRVVFTTICIALVNFVGLNRTIRYGAPTAIEDYFQESGHAGRSGAIAKSTIFWKPPLGRIYPIL